MRALSLPIIAFILAGCGGGGELLVQQRGEIEYLNAENERLQRTLIEIQQEQRNNERRIEALNQQMTDADMNASNGNAQPIIVERPAGSQTPNTVDVLSHDLHFLSGTARLNTEGIRHMHRLLRG